MSLPWRRTKDYTIPESDRFKGSKGHTKLVREPTVSFAEAAEKLGITGQALVAYMHQQSEGAPTPCFETRSHSRKENRRYHMSDFKRWWSTVQLKKEAA